MIFLKKEFLSKKRSFRKLFNFFIFKSRFFLLKKISLLYSIIFFDKAFFSFLFHTLYNKVLLFIIDKIKNFFLSKLTILFYFQFQIFLIKNFKLLSAIREILLRELKNASGF